MLTEEDITYIKLKCTVTTNDSGSVRYYWDEPAGGHIKNKILLMEFYSGGKWHILEEDCPFG